METVSSIFAASKVFDLGQAVRAVYVAFSNPTTIAIAIALASMTDAAGTANASYSELANRSGMNARTIAKHMLLILGLDILLRDGNPRMPFVYHWNLGRLAELAAKDRKSGGGAETDKMPVLARSIATLDSGASVALRALETAYRTRAERAFRKFGKLPKDQAYVAPPTRWDRREQRDAVATWLASFAGEHGCTVELAADHLARVYVEHSSADRERSRAWASGLPLTWVFYELNRAGAWPIQRVQGERPLSNEHQNPSNEPALSRSQIAEYARAAAGGVR